MADPTPFIVAILAFCATVGIAFVAGQYYQRAVHLYRRLPVPHDAVEGSGSAGGGISGFVARHFDEKRFGVDDTLRGQLRRNLVRAGYFRRDAINFYVLWRLVIVGLLPLFAYLFLSVAAPAAPFSTSFIVILISMGLGIIAPDAFIARKQRLLSAEYRTIFPDFLDLLTVCVDAGLSPEGALGRITSEIDKRHQLFGINLEIMSAEMRAGRTFVEALGTLADRLMIPEAQSLVAVLRQSAELGSDVGEALRVFSDEMRNRRLLRAEEQANKLSVRMLMPLAIIFLVVLIVVLLPIALRVAAIFR